MEAELLRRRQQQLAFEPVEAVANIGGIEFEISDFVLFLEQILIFSLVVGKSKFLIIYIYMNRLYKLYCSI